MTQVIDARATFDVTTTYLDRDVAEVRIARAPRVELRRRQERVIAVDQLPTEEWRLAGAAAEERARRRDLRQGAIVHEHELGVDAGLVAEVIVREQARGLALVRTLIVVVRGEVELVRGRPRPQLARRLIDRRIEAAGDETAMRGRRGARAGERARVARRAGRSQRGRG